MKKRLLAAVLCVVMVATMTSCGKKEETKKDEYIISRTSGL